MQGKMVLGTAAWDAEMAPAPVRGAGKGDAGFVQPEPIYIPGDEPREENGSREGPQHQPVLLFLAPEHPRTGALALPSAVRAKAKSNAAPRGSERERLAD